MADNKQRRERRAVSLIDPAVANLIRLIKDRGAELASGSFGVLIVLDRGQHRHIKLYQEQTIDTATAVNN